MAIKAMPVASNAIGNYIDRSLTALAGKQSANSVIDATNKAATDAGYKIPTATINPSAVNTTIEGIASKVGTAQKASLDNAPITDSLARQAANLPANTPLTDVTLKTAKAPFNKVYEDMKAAGPFQVDSQYPVSSLSPDITANAISGADAINSIKTLRNKASTLWDGWKSSGNPETLDSAIAHTGAANDLESLVGRNLETANPELLQQFQDARTSLAKINTVQDALIQGGGSIDAKVLGKMTQSGIPLTDELKVIGDFANNHPQLVQTLKKVGSPGVNNLRALTTSALSIGAGGAGFTLGGPAGAIAGAALPMALESLAKRAALRLTTPSYTPGMAAQGLPIIPPAVAASMIAGSNNRNLTNVPTNILQNILRNPSQQLVGNDIALNKLLGGNNETISARLGKSRNTSVMSAALANELDRIDPGHIDRALAAQQQGQP